MARNVLDLCRDTLAIARSDMESFHHVRIEGRLMTVFVFDLIVFKPTCVVPTSRAV